jgi:hypothetical protein
LETFDYYTVLQNVLTDEYYRTIQMDYDGMITKFGVYVSKFEKETLKVSRFSRDGCAPGYERLQHTSRC